MKALLNLMAITAVATLAGCASLPQGTTQSGGLGIPSAVSAAGQIPTYGAAAGVPGSVAGAAPLAGQGFSLTDTLVRQLGVTPVQATGGAGSVFSMAQQGMNPSDFAQVSKAVPGMDQYLAAAPSQAATSPATSGLMGAAGSLTGGSGNPMGTVGNLMGGSGGTLGTAASLAGSFQSLGMNSGMASQFIPIILQYVQNQGGASTMGLLQSALLH